jgi:opacity protein-like surface antigen
VFVDISISETKRKDMKIGLKRLSGLLLAGVVLFTFASTEAMAKKKTKDGVYIGGNLAYINLGDATVEADIVVGGMQLHVESTFKSKSALGGSVVVGFKKQDMDMKFEAEYLTHKNDTDKAEQKITGAINLTQDLDVEDGDYLKASTIFLSAYKLIKIDRQMSGVVGGGLGSTKYEDNEDLDEKATSFHISGGVEKQLNANLTIVGMIRFIKYGDYTISEDGVDADISFDLTTALQAGIRYQF